MVRDFFGINEMLSAGIAGVLLQFCEAAFLQRLEVQKLSQELP